MDPVKEATGDRMEVENLSAAPSDIAARRGQNFDDVVARSARDNRAIQRAGLQLGDIGTMAAAASGRDEEEPPRQGR